MEKSKTLEMKPGEDLKAVFAREKERINKDNSILVPESLCDTAVRIAKENNIAVKFEPVKAVWKTDSE